GVVPMSGETKEKERIREIEKEGTEAVEARSGVPEVVTHEVVEMVEAQDENKDTALSIDNILLIEESTTDVATDVIMSEEKGEKKKKKAGTERPQGVAMPTEVEMIIVEEKATEVESPQEKTCLTGVVPQTALDKVEGEVSQGKMLSMGAEA
ncbi:hypothetical protein Dimus_013132, partial [Dionaea muscipula]